MLHYTLSEFLKKAKVTTTITARIKQLKYNCHKIFYSIIMLRFGKVNVSRKELYGGKRPIKMWDVNVDNIVI